MIIGILVLLIGLTISAVAVFYSVSGLAAIFAAAPIPIMIMGTVLEIAKLVSAWWVKSNWLRAPKLLKYYMVTAIVILMLITSMGIFGFLSKAHSDQSIPSGDIVAAVALIDTKIQTQNDNINTTRESLSQIDKSVNETLVRYKSGTKMAISVRKNYSKEKEALLKEIETAQQEIAKLNEERAPIAAKMRRMDAEVGPIKYIAKLVYGDNPDQNLLEKAVSWVTIIIIFVFDPLAVLMLLSAQMSFQWAKEDKLALEQSKLAKSDLIEEDLEEVNTLPEPTETLSDWEQPIIQDHKNSQIYEKNFTTIRPTWSNRNSPRQ